MTEDYLRIEEAIRYLEENFRDQPGLDDLAQHLHTSPFHLQRLFRRWVGISPKRFLQFLTIDYAKKLLEESRSVLDSTYEAGLSSPGRLHDLFVNIDAVTPGEFKSKGEGLQIYYGFHDSPFGTCLLAVTDRGICGMSFHDPSNLEAGLAELGERWRNSQLVDAPQQTRAFFERIFSGSGSDEGMPLNLFLKGTNFQIKVWEALMRIPSGLVCSYEDIARQIGNPGAVRAVGSAVGANPISYLIPCHRVIRKMGSFGDYHWGSARKKAILGWEAAQKFKYETEPELAD